MPKTKAWKFVVLAVLLIVTVVLFALTLAIFIKLQNYHVIIPESKSESTNSTVDVPSTVAPYNLAWYSGKFTDDDTEWRQEWANPTSRDYLQQKEWYENEIRDALANVNPAAYGNARVKINSLSGRRVDSSRTSTHLHATIGVTPPHSASRLAQDLSSGPHSWRDISIEESGLPPLPEPDTSPGWKVAASMFIESMNTSVNPCEDFYRYSCDNYIAAHPLGNQSSQSTFSVLQKWVLTNLTESFEKLITQPPQQIPEAVKMVGDMYKSCKTAKNGTYNGSELVLDIANEYGGWPILNPDWNITNVPHDIYWMIGDMTTRYGISTLLSPMVSINFKNVTSNNMLFLDQANLAIPSAYYNSPNLTDRYQNLLRSIINQTVQVLDPHLPLDTVADQIDRMVQIEYRLAQISVDARDQRNMSTQFNQYTIDEASTEYNTINWTSYFEGLIGSALPNDNPDDLLDPFVIAEPSYVSQLDAFLSNDTDTVDLVNYLIYRLIAPHLQFAGPKASELTYLLRKETKIDQLDATSDTAMECVSWLVQAVPYAAGRVYVDSYFPAGNRDQISVMINEVLSAFGSSLGALNWMDYQTALKAFNKVAGLIRNVAYPDFEQDNGRLDEYYNGLIEDVRDIHPQDEHAYYQYFLRSSFFQGRLMLSDLKKEGSRIEFLMSPAVVNAWYQPERNSITFPAAILNPPFYRSDFPQAVNYGGLGVGFDDQGVQFDADGTLYTWMTPQAERGFKAMAQCVVDEYGSFCYPEACLNGVTTQGENIGDNGGLKAAYRGYSAYTAAHGEEKPLPGMEMFTMDQIFFLSYAQVWCGSYSSDALRRLLLTNPHSPGRDRVLGAVRNFPKFGEAFHCNLGDPMYPTEACDVW